MRYFAFAIKEDQPHNITRGFISLDKIGDNFRIWHQLRVGDYAFVAPISVPFKVYVLEVRAVGLLANTGVWRRDDGYLIYFDCVLENDNVKTSLYTIQVFARPTSVTESVAKELLKAKFKKREFKYQRQLEDVFPIILPDAYQLAVATGEDDIRFIEQCLRLHPFSVSDRGMAVILKKNQKAIGGAIVRLNAFENRFHHMENHIFGDSLRFIRDESVHIARLLSKDPGARRHITFEKVITGVLFVSRHLFNRPTTFVSGVSYDLIPAAYRVGARIAVPDRPNAALFYWKSFLPESQPLSADEYEQVKREYRAIMRKRRASSWWCVFGADRDITAAVANKVWLLSEGRSQLVKWRAIKKGDQIIICKRNANPSALATVHGTSRRKYPGYERFPLAISFAETSPIDDRTSAGLSEMTRWLAAEHDGGISSVPTDVALEIENYIEDRTGGMRMWVTPNPMLLRGADFLVRKKQLFVVQSWNLRDSVLPAIRVICERHGYLVTHSEDRHGQVIFDPIWRLMNESEAIIVDFSGQRPNVFLEYGMALVLGKPIIAITQDKSDVPSDTPNLKWNLYKERTALVDLEKVLAGAIGQTIADISAMATPRHSGVR